MHSSLSFWPGATLLLSVFNAVYAIPPRQLSYPSGPGYDVPPLASIVSNYPPQPTVPLPPAPLGATLFAGAPALPPLSNMQAIKWPEVDVIPRTDSPEVKEWLKEIEGINIPKLSITNGDCSDPANVDSGPDKRCWWTCGGCVRPTDIATCKDKGHWGLTFDDGPSESAPKLLTYLNSVGVKATFFLVGSRVIGAPETVQYQHATGHELAVHTWSHSSLTNLTNAQIVAELGWTRKAIKEATGVTPLTMRPPRGDIDDRVRAISMAMGLTPVLWTGGDGVSFDTNDWRVPAGEITAEQSISTFQGVLNSTVDTLSTGFITLEHDLFPQTVDLAIGTTIPNALGRKFKVEPVMTCQDKSLSESYRETTKNLLAPPLPAKDVPSSTAVATTATPSLTSTATRTTTKPTDNAAPAPSAALPPPPAAGNGQLAPPPPDNGQLAPPPTDNGQLAPPSTDIGQPAPPPPDNAALTPPPTGPAAPVPLPVTGNTALAPPPMTTTSGTVMIAGSIWRSLGAIALCWSFLSLI